MPRPWRSTHFRAIAVHGSQNDSFDQYAGSDGALLWEQYGNQIGYPEPEPAITVLDNGDVVIEGGNYLAKYTALDGRLIWEKRYNGYMDAPVANSKSFFMILPFGCLYVFYVRKDDRK